MDVIDFSWTDRASAIQELQLLVASCYADYPEAIAVFEGEKSLSTFEWHLATWSNKDMDECGREWCRRIYDHHRSIPTESNFGKDRAKTATVTIDSEQFWISIRKELYLLICTDDNKYDEARRNLSVWTGQKSQLAYASAISVGLAAHIGITAATMLTPLCAICVLATLYIGHQVLCSRLVGRGPIGVTIKGDIQPPDRLRARVKGRKGWVKAATRTALAEGEVIGIDIAGQQIAIYQLDGSVFATSDICTHASARLSDGWFDEKGEIECPLHAGRFDVRTGTAVCGPATKAITTYPVRIVDDEIQVKLA